MLTEGATPLHRVADLNAAPPQCHFTAIAHRDQFFRRHAIDEINTTLVPAGRADIFPSSRHLPLTMLLPIEAMLRDPGQPKLALMQTLGFIMAVLIYSIAA